MDDNNNVVEQEEFHWSKGLIFTAIVLFPLIPFVLIYKHKFKRKTKIILFAVYFAFLTGAYQAACMLQGPVIHEVTISDRYVNLKPGSTYQINFETTPSKDKLTIDDIEYTSNNKAVVTVNRQGLVTTLSPGKATVKVTVYDNHFASQEKDIKFVVHE